MSTIVTRAGKGSPLTNTEVDSNFTNLNTDKAEIDTHVTFLSVGTTAINATGDVTISSASPELFLKDTDGTNSQARVQGTSSGAGYRARGTDVNGNGQFGSHNFSRFDGATTKTQATLDANGDFRVWNAAGQARLFWDASYDSDAGALAIGQSAVPSAKLTVNGNIGSSSHITCVEGLAIGSNFAAGEAPASDLQFRNSLNEQVGLTASATGTTLTVTAVDAGETIDVGDLIYGTSDTPANLFIVQQLSGTTGGVGTYEISQAWERDSVNLYGRDRKNNRIRFTDVDGGMRSGSPIGTIDFEDSDGTNDGVKGFIGCYASDTSPSTHIAFGTNLSDDPNTPHAREVARFDESGNLQIGKTVEGDGVDGHSLKGNGRAIHTASSAIPLLLNRNTNDGFVTEYRKDNVRCGFIASANGHITVGGGGGNGLKFSSTAVQPRTSGNGNNDAVIQLGTSSSRFTDLHLSSGVYFADAGSAGTSSSNKLDNYEEGTFTPSLQDAASGGNTATVGQARGFYTKIGNTVTVNITLTNITKADLTADNDLYIHDLPFAARTVNADVKFTSCPAMNLWHIGNATPIFSVQDGGSVGRLYKSPTNGNAYEGIKASEINSNAGADIWMTLTYQTAT